MSWALIPEHLYIVLASVMASLLLGLPLGVAAYLSPRARRPILWISDLFQTIPSLALLGILMVFFGAGKVTVICGITLYSLLPIVRNTCLGLQEVPAGLKEAARGCGMSRMDQLFRVEVPQAYPMILTGVRIAVVNAIGTAVFAAFVGGGGIGSAIYQGIRVQDMKTILLATGALMVIALLFDTLMSWVEKNQKSAERHHPHTKRGLAAVLSVLAVLLVGGTVYYSGGSGRPDIVMYDGTYSELQLMHRCAKMLIEDRTNLTVEIKDQMTAVNTFNEMKADQPSCDLMMSYDGTLLTTFLHLDPSDVPAGETLYDYANRIAMERHGLRLLGKVGLNNTYAIAVTAPTAERYHLTKVSDLIPYAGELTFGAEHDFFTLEGSMKYHPFTKFYGLKFKDSVPVDIALKYATVESGGFEVTEVYATDGLNRKAGLKLLEDDRHFFPEYNGALLVRDSLFEELRDKCPELESILEELTGKISTEDMTDMTYRCDVLGDPVDEVAREFLIEAGLISP